VASELAAAAAHALPELPKLASPVPPFTPAETTVQAAGTSFACWGAEVRGTADGCVPDFEPGKGHFKNKFCAHCREGVAVPAARLRALRT